MATVVNNFLIGTSKRSITLQRYGMTTYVEGRTQGYRAKLVVIEAVDMPLDVFVYQRVAPVAVGGVSEDFFTNVASPGDLEEYQVGVVADLTRPFYRLREVDLVTRSLDLLNEGLRGIIGDLSQLVESLNMMDKLVLQEEIIIGDSGAVDANSSSSSSSSSSTGP